MIWLLLATYPAHWRRRYGEEFRAVLESRPLGPFDVADILLGALDARLRAPRFAGAPANAGGHLTMLRLGGFAAIAGGSLWVAGFVGGSTTRDGSALWFALLGAGNVGILIALVGLSAFQGHRDPRLAWVAFLIPAVGVLSSLVGLVGLATRPSDLPWLLGLAPWGMVFLGLLATIVGSILFGIATYRARVLSATAAKALAGSATAVTILAGVSSMGVTPIEGMALILVAGSIFAFGASWAWLGISALRRGPIRAIAPA
jgi:hypothetical protein